MKHLHGDEQLQGDNGPPDPQCHGPAPKGPGCFGGMKELETKKRLGRKVRCQLSFMKASSIASCDLLDGEPVGDVNCVVFIDHELDEDDDVNETPVLDEKDDVTPRAAL